MGLGRVEDAWTKVFAVRQVCEKYLVKGKMYFRRLWIWKRHMIRSTGMVCGRS